MIPWATFTDPEVARVGLNEHEATEQESLEVTRYGLEELDRAITDEAARGFVKVLTVPGKDRILGATIVGAHAGELIAEYVLAMKHGIGLNKHPRHDPRLSDHCGGEQVRRRAMEARQHARAWAVLAAFHAWRRGEDRLGQARRVAGTVA